MESLAKLTGSVRGRWRQVPLAIRIRRRSAGMNIFAANRCIACRSFITSFAKRVIVPYSGAKPHTTALVYVCLRDETTEATSQILHHVLTPILLSLSSELSARALI